MTSADLAPALLDMTALEDAAALADAGFPDRAHDRASHILDHARTACDQRLIACATACLAATSRMRGECEAGIGFAREAKELLLGQGDLARAARAGGNLAWLLATIGEPDGIAEALAALDRAEAAGDPTETILALDANAVALWLLHQPDQALPFAERAAELSRLQQPRIKRPLINLAGIRVELAMREDGGPAVLAQAVEDAIALTKEALTLSRTDGDGWIERVALCNIAEYRLHLADADGAERALAGFTRAAGEPTPRCRANYLHMLGRIRAGQRRLEDAIHLLTTCVEAATRRGDLETATPCHKDLSDYLARLGRHAQALDAHRAFHESYVRQASLAGQRRARLYTLEWEAHRLRLSVDAALDHAAELTAANKVLAQETERLLRASMEDPLTGLQNRRCLDLAFLDHLTHGAPYALAMIDVDCFKQVNDRFSHVVGDSALKAVAGLLRLSARAGDLIVRYGGDEFALLLPQADLATASITCERLLRRVRAHDWGALQAGLRVSLSIGVAASYEAESSDAVLAQADHRLYRAKQGGRDRVVSA